LRNWEELKKRVICKPALRVHGQKINLSFIRISQIIPMPSAFADKKSHRRYAIGIPKKMASSITTATWALKRAVFYEKLRDGFVECFAK
jgi:hypothetical protein